MAERWTRGSHNSGCENLDRMVSRTFDDWCFTAVEIISYMTTLCSVFVLSSHLQYERQSDSMHFVCTHLRSKEAQRATISTFLKG